MMTEAECVGIDHAAMESFLDDLKHDILALNLSLKTLESAWHVMITQTQGDIPTAFAERSAIWTCQMQNQITVLEIMHSILSKYLEDSRALEARRQKKLSAVAAAD